MSPDPTTYRPTVPDPDRQADPQPGSRFIGNDDEAENVTAYIRRQVEEARENSTAGVGT